MTRAALIAEPTRRAPSTSSSLPASRDLFETTPLGPAMLWLVDGQWWLDPVGHRVPLAINGFPAGPEAVALHDGDLIELDDAAWTFADDSGFRFAGVRTVVDHVLFNASPNGWLHALPLDGGPLRSALLLDHGSAMSDFDSGRFARLRMSSSAPACVVVDDVAGVSFGAVLHAWTMRGERAEPTIVRAARVLLAEAADVRVTFAGSLVGVVVPTPRSVFAAERAVEVHRLITPAAGAPDPAFVRAVLDELFPVQVARERTLREALAMGVRPDQGDM